MDVCNLLWRSRAFNTTDTNALGCFLPFPVLQSLRAYTDGLAPPQTLSTLFSLSHNISLGALSIAIFRELEDKAVESGDEVRTRHAGPITQRTLAALSMEGGVAVSWADYRLEVLKWLADRGAEGIRQLMFCTMKLLIGVPPAVKSNT